MPDSITLDAPVKGSPAAPLLLTGPAVAPLLLTGPAPLKKAPIETAVAVGGGAVNHTGVVTFIDNMVDRTTGTILLRATIANPDHGLLPGQYMTARLHLGDQEGALMVPQTAVGASQMGRFLMTIGKDGKAEQHVVKLGDSTDDMVVVIDGLKAGDRVITGQLQKLKPGMPVEPEDGASGTPPK